ncbi:MAG: magnesium transporter [Acidobacteriota bacterium]
MRPQRVNVMASSVQRLLRRNAYSHITNLLAKLRAADISSIMLEMNDREQLSVFSILMERDRQLASETLKTLGVEWGLDLLLQRPSDEISEVIQEMESDAAASFISALPEVVAQEVLEKMDVQESSEVQELLAYDEETAGRIMTPNVFSLYEELSVGEAIQTIQTAQDFEMVFYLYVVDERNHLVGVVSLRQLLMVAPNTSLKMVMIPDVITVTTDTDQEEVANQVALYDLLAIPVVDDTNKLVGAITVDDVIDVIQEEATEDIFYLAGVEADDHIHTSALLSVRKRLPWLMVNLVTALLAATVVALYEPTIAKFSFLAVFLPVVAGMGGNSGTQTLTVIVRGLALGDVSWESGKAILWKEILVGINNGVATGIIAGTVAYLWKGNYMLGLVLGGSMAINVVVAGIVGTLIPLILKKFNVDPAIASGIFVTTFTDAVGFLSFLGLATALLRYLPA